MQISAGKALLQLKRCSERKADGYRHSCTLHYSIYWFWNLFPDHFFLQIGFGVKRMQEFQKNAWSAAVLPSRINDRGLGWPLSCKMACSLISLLSMLWLLAGDVRGILCHSTALVHDCHTELVSQTRALINQGVQRRVCAVSRGQPFLKLLPVTLMQNPWDSFHRPRQRDDREAAPHWSTGAQACVEERSWARSNCGTGPACGGTAAATASVRGGFGCY